MKFLEEINGLAVKMLDAQINYDVALDLFENAYISAVLKVCNGHQGNAAAMMGVHRNTITRKLDKPRHVIVATLRKGALLKPQPLDPLNQAMLNDAEENPSAYLLRAPLPAVTPEALMQAVERCTRKASVSVSQEMAS